MKNKKFLYSFLFVSVLILSSVGAWVAYAANFGSFIANTAGLTSPATISVTVNSNGGNQTINATINPAGLCGGANNVCNVGILNDIADNASNYLWECRGFGTAATDSCSISKVIPVNGQCSNPLVLNTCDAGTLNDIADDASNYRWQCVGLNGGSTASCSLPIPASVDGACAATHYNCSAGSSINNTEDASNYYWSCQGSGTGSTASCSEAKGASTGTFTFSVRVNGVAYAGPNFSVVLDEAYSPTGLAPWNTYADVNTVVPSSFAANAGVYYFYYKSGAPAGTVFSSASPMYGGDPKAAQATLFPGGTSGIILDFITSTNLYDPLGTFDAADCSLLQGWAFDRDVPSQSINVHLYKDGPYGSGGVYVGQYTANVSRPDVNAAYSSWGITGDHGFAIATPISLKDGVAHPLYIYAINNNGVGPNPLIAASPKSITCAAAAPTPDLKVNDSSYNLVPVDGPIVTYNGSPYTLSWGAVAGAVSCTLDGSVVSVAGGTQVENALSQTKTHTLICLNALNQAGTDQVIVTVPPPPTNLTTSCVGNQMTASWNLPVGGYTESYFRAKLGVNNITNPPDFSDDSAVSPKTITVNPGNTYTIWVHTKSMTNGAWSPEISVNASCPAAVSYNLTVDSLNPASGVAMTVTPGNNGSTSFTNTYNSGTAVSVTAPATASGNNFSNWVGCNSAAGTICNVTMNSNRAITANYNPPTFSLLVVKAGQGTVKSNPAGVNCGVSCSAQYAPGTLIVLTETPNTGRIFTGWTGVTCSGAGETQKTSTCTFTIVGNMTIYANFAIDPNYREF